MKEYNKGVRRKFIEFTIYFKESEQKSAGLAIKPENSEPS
jgi:hypothetical protein